MRGHSFGKGQQILILFFITFLLITPIMMYNSLVYSNFDGINSPKLTLEKDVRQVPPEEAPPVNWSTGWYSIFGNMTNFGSTLNLSAPPSTDYVSLFEKGLMDPNMILFIVSPAYPLRYWRLESYDAFNSHSWLRTNNTKVEKTEFDEPISGSVNFQISMNISHFLFDTRYIPILWPTPRITSLSLADAFKTTLSYDAYDGIILDSVFQESGTSLLEYGVTYDNVDLNYITSHALTADYTPNDILNMYTQLPNNLSSTVHDFANQFRGQGNNVYETAMIVMAYFKTHFTFDMDMFLGNSTDQPPPDTDVVTWFLNRKKGTAAHFATAYVVTLRDLGIAARPVFGFTPGFEVAGNKRVVKAINIHAWAEVYVPYDSSGKGIWMQFDPTPLPEDLSFEDDTMESVTYSLVVSNNATLRNVTRVDYSDTSEANRSLSYTLLPIVCRNESLSIYATVYENLKPYSNATITFYDQTEDRYLGSAITNASGIAEIVVTFDDTFVTGTHVVVASMGFISNATYYILCGNTSLSLNSTSDEADVGTQFTIRGRLYDSNNEKGLWNQTVFIRYDNTLIGSVVTDEDGYFESTILISAYSPLGIHNVSVVYPGLFYLYNDTSGPIPIPKQIFYIKNSSAFKNITLYARPILTIQSNVSEIERGDSLLISGSIMYPNGTAIYPANISVIWYNTSSIEYKTNTTLFGEYNLTIHVPPNHTTMYVSVQAKYISPYTYVRNATSSSLQILVYLVGSLSLDVTSGYEYNHSQTIIITGQLLDDFGDPLSGKPIAIIFEGQTVFTTTTNESGYYNATFAVPNSFRGNTSVYATSTSVFIRATTSQDYIAIYAFSKVSSVSVNALYLMPNESLIISGYVYDDTNLPVSGNLSIFFDDKLILNTTSNNGYFEDEIYIPSSASAGWHIITAHFYRQSYYISSQSNTSVYVFTDAVIDLSVEPNSTEPRSSIRIAGNVTDTLGERISGRTLLIFIKYNESGTVHDVLAGNTTLDNGYFERNITVPTQISEGIIQIYVILIGSRNITSQEAIVEVKSVILQIPGLEQSDLLIAILFVVIIAIVLYLKRDVIKGIFAGQVLGKRVKVDVKELLNKLAEFVNTGNYTAAIFTSYQILVTLLENVKGIVKSPNETVREYLYRAAISGGLPVGDIEEFVSVYEKARYAADPPTQDDYLVLIQSFARLYQAITGREIRLV